MHRRGDAVAKQVKKTNKTKKEKKNEKKRLGCASPLVSPTYEPSNSHNGPSLPRFPFFILLRRAAAVRQG
jgi:hypothetical protein